MPHLSPMSWIMFMPLLWLLIALMMTQTFFTITPSFSSVTMNKESKISHSWKW